jgi:hypothetical protein
MSVVIDSVVVIYKGMLHFMPGYVAALSAATRGLLASKYPDQILSIIDKVSLLKIPKYSKPVITGSDFSTTGFRGTGYQYNRL